MGILERLRYLADYPWSAPDDMLDELFNALWALGDESRQLQMAVRRVLQRQCHFGELWRISSIVLQALDPHDGVGDAYVQWSEHRSSCQLHGARRRVRIPESSEELSAFTRSRAVVRRGWIDEESMLVEVPHSCTWRALDEWCIDLIESELPENRPDLVIVALGTPSVLVEEGTVALAEVEYFEPLDSLRAPFAHRLGR